MIIEIDAPVFIGDCIGFAIYFAIFLRVIKNNKIKSYRRLFTFYGFSTPLLLAEKASEVNSIGFTFIVWMGILWGVYALTNSRGKNDN
jgi:hypothetical protein